MSAKHDIPLSGKNVSNKERLLVTVTVAGLFAVYAWSISSFWEQTKEAYRKVRTEQHKAPVKSMKPAMRP